MEKGLPTPKTQSTYTLKPSCIHTANYRKIVALQPNFTFVVQFVQNATTFRFAVPSRRTGRANARPLRITQDEVVINVVHGLLDIVVEPVPPNLAVVTPSFPRFANGKAADVARANIVVTRPIFTKVRMEEGVELQLPIFVV